MKGVAGVEEACGQGFGPASADEFEVGRGVGAVEFITDDGVADVGEVDADLVEAAGLWGALDEAERAGGGVEAGFDPADAGEGGSAGGNNALFEING